MNYHTDLNIGEVVYIWIIFYIPVFWINLLTGYDFYFWWPDTANQPYVFKYLRSCSIVMWYHAVPLLFVALHEYKPKSPTVLGVSVNVLMSCVELTPSNITRPSLNHVILTRGFAYTAHFMVVNLPIHDLTTTFEEALLLKWGLSNNRKNEHLNQQSDATSFNWFTFIAF